jgi:hypothetical protein
LTAFLHPAHSIAWPSKYRASIVSPGLTVCPQAVSSSCGSFRRCTTGRGGVDGIGARQSTPMSITPRENKIVCCCTLLRRGSWGPWPLSECEPDGSLPPRLDPTALARLRFVEDASWRPSSRHHVSSHDRPFFRPDISPVGADRASVMRCRRSLVSAVGRCCCCHRCCQPLVLCPSPKSPRRRDCALSSPGPSPEPDCCRT